MPSVKIPKARRAKKVFDDDNDVTDATNTENTKKSRKSSMMSRMSSVNSTKWTFPEAQPEHATLLPALMSAIERKKPEKISRRSKSSWNRSALMTSLGRSIMMDDNNAATDASMRKSISNKKKKSSSDAAESKKESDMLAEMARRIGQLEAENAALKEQRVAMVARFQKIQSDMMSAKKELETRQAKMEQMINERVPDERDRAGLVDYMKQGFGVMLGAIIAIVAVDLLFAGVEAVVDYATDDEGSNNDSQAGDNSSGNSGGEDFLGDFGVDLFGGYYYTSPASKKATSIKSRRRSPRRRSGRAAAGSSAARRRP
jgi:hypothetical protein